MVRMVAEERIKIWTSRVGSGEGLPGNVIEAGQTVEVACGQGSLELVEVQLPGKRRQQTRDLVNAGRLQIGTVLE